MECIICYSVHSDSNETVEKICSNGHHFHISCVKKQFKAECSICREKLNISVTGTLYDESDYTRLVGETGGECLTDRQRFYGFVESQRDQLVAAEIEDIHDTLDSMSEEIYNMFTPNYYKLQNLARELSTGCYSYEEYTEAQRLNEDFKYYIELENSV